MTRKKKTINNFLATAIQQIIMVICNFVIVKLIIENYGNELNGLYNFLLQAFNYFKLIEGGLIAAAVYSLYAPLSAKDNTKLVSILNTLKKNFYRISIYFGFLLLILAIVLPMYMEIKNYSSVDIFLFVIVLGLSTCVDFLWVVRERVLLTADQRIYVLSYTNSIFALIQLLLIILVVTLNGEFLLIWIFNIVLVAIKALFLNRYNNKLYKLDYSKSVDGFIIDQRNSAIYNQILGAIQISSPIVLTTILFNDLFLTSVISVYLLVATGVNKVLDIFKSGIYPLFGNLIASNERILVRRYFNIFNSTFLVVVSLITCSTLILINPFVLLYLNNNYVIVSFGFLICLDILFYNLKVPLGTLIIASGKFKETRIQVTIQALIILIGGIILGLVFGINGIIIASILSNLYRLIDMIYFVNKYILDNIVKHISVNIIISLAVLMCNLCIYFLNPITIDTWNKWIYIGVLHLICNFLIITILQLVFNKKEYLETLFFLKRLVR